MAWSSLPVSTYPGTITKPNWPIKRWIHGTASLYFVSVGSTPNSHRIGVFEKIHVLILWDNQDRNIDSMQNWNSVGTQNKPSQTLGTFGTHNNKTLWKFIANNPQFLIQIERRTTWYDRNLIQSLTFYKISHHFITQSWHFCINCRCRFCILKMHRIAMKEQQRNLGLTGKMQPPLYWIQGCIRKIYRADDLLIQFHCKYLRLGQNRIGIRNALWITTQREFVRP